MRKTILLLPLVIAFIAVLAFALIEQDASEAGDPGSLMSLETNGSKDKAEIDIGTSFKLSIIAKGIPANGYIGAQAGITWFNKDITGEDLILKDNDTTWPDCDPGAKLSQKGLNNAFRACQTLLGTPSFHQGELFSFILNCPTQKGTHNIVFDPGSAIFFDDQGQLIVPGLTSVQVNCVNPKTEISLAAHGTGVSCDGQPSTNKGVVPKPLKCDVPLGGTLTVSIEINAAPAAGYELWVTELVYGALIYKKAPLISDEVVDPTCNFINRIQDISRVAHTCQNIVPKSHFVGNIVELEFNCTATKSSNSIDLIPPFGVFGGTFFHEFATALRVFPNLDSLGINCVNSVKLPKPGDTDGDGCPDAHENRPKTQASSGGGRDWQDPNDYYDVYGPGQSLTRDGVIDLPNDILGVVQHYSPGGAPPYDVRFDRGQTIGANHWERAGPDGVIDLANDILGVVFQYNHNCV
jgi:hypothetical protein